MATKKKTAKKKRKPRSKPTAPYRVPLGRALMLRTCSAQMTSHGGFVWPRSGPVAAPDWNKRAACGNGLHGFLWGVGDVTLASSAEDAVWLVVEIEAASVVDLGGKVKVPRGVVLYAGARIAAVAMVQEHAPADAGPCMYGTATAGYAGTATAGVRGTATAGYAGTATAGDAGTATAGYAGTATAGVRGTATAGVRGTATAGYAGTATAGYAGTATAGDAGTATAGLYGCLAIEWYDAAKSVYRKLVAEVDGVTIKAGVPYVVRDGRFVAKDAA